VSWIGKLLLRLGQDSPSLLVLGRLGASGLALVSAPIVARAIGPDGRGQTAAAIALFFLVPILLAIGIPLVVRRLSATSDGKSALRTARLYCLGILPISTITSVLLGSTIFSQFDDFTRIVAMVGIAFSPMMTSWSCDVSMLVAQGRYRSVMFMQLVQPGLYVLSVTGLAVLQIASTATVLLASIAGTAATFITGILLTQTSIRGEYLSILELTSSGLRFAGSSIAEAATSRLDQVLVLPLIGAVQAGIYSVAVTVASVPLALGQALAASYFSPIARSESQERRELQSAAVRSAVAIALMSSPFAIVGIYFGIPVLFGDDFAGAVPVALVCLAGTLVMLVAYVCSMSLAAAGMGGIMSIAQFISLGISIVALYILSPSMGALGAATASLLGYVVLFSILVSALRLPVRMIIPSTPDFRESIRRLLKDK
jgi:O-antigen/teichoic acid export membrane protein